MNARFQTTSQANKENVPLSPTISRSQSARPSFPSPASINFSLDESFQGMPHLQRYFGSKLASARQSNTLSWDPSSNSPESVESFNANVAKSKPPSPPRCHVCGTLCDNRKSKLHGLRSYTRRILDVFRHFGTAPGTFLNRLLLSTQTPCGKDSDELSASIARFYSDRHILKLLNTWATNKEGKKQILEWINGEGSSIVYEELAKEGDSLCTRFSFTSSKADPKELLGLDFESISNILNELAPTFMTMLRAFAIPNRRTEESGSKESMRKIVSRTSIYAFKTL